MNRPHDPRTADGHGVIIRLDPAHAPRKSAAPMVTDVVGFAAFADSFEALKTPNHQCKILLEPG